MTATSAASTDSGRAPGRLDALTIPLGRPAGVPLSADLGVLVVTGLLFWMLWSSFLPLARPGAGDWWRAAAAALGCAAYLLSVLLHEVGHAVLARRHGVGVLAITLWFFGGAAHLDRPAPNPRAELQIALAGPLVNFGLAGVFGVGTVFLGGWRGEGLAALFTWLAGVNVIFAVSNLLPGAPLDGGRVLAALLWMRSGKAETSRLRAARSGLAIGALLFVLGCVFLRWPGSRIGWPTLLFGGVIAAGAATEVVRAGMRKRLDDVTVGEIMAVHPPLIDPDATLEQALLSGLGVARPVGRLGQPPMGWMVDTVAATVDEPERSWTSVRSVMVPTDSVCRAWSTEPLGAVLGRATGEPPEVIVIHDPDSGSVIGTCSRNQVYGLLGEPVDRWGRDRSPTSNPLLTRLGLDDKPR